MQQLEEFFEPKKLTQKDLDVISFVLTSPAYNDVFEPYLRGIRNSMAHSMLDRSEARKDVMPDDFLAGGITTIDGLLGFFKLLIEESDVTRIHESLAQKQTGEMIYHKRQGEGQLSPVLGINQEPLPAVVPVEEDY
jgi:hypothetical protein